MQRCQDSILFQLCHSKCMAIRQCSKDFIGPDKGVFPFVQACVSCCTVDIISSPIKHQTSLGFKYLLSNALWQIACVLLVHVKRPCFFQISLLEMAPE